MAEAPTYAVTGATGEVGGRVAARLAAEGVPQRIVVRDPSRAPDLPATQVRQAGGFAVSAVLTTPGGGPLGDRANVAWIEYEIAGNGVFEHHRAWDFHHLGLTAPSGDPWSMGPVARTVVVPILRTGVEGNDRLYTYYRLTHGDGGEGTRKRRPRGRGDDRLPAGADDGSRPLDQGGDADRGPRRGQCAGAGGGARDGERFPDDGPTDGTG